MVKSTLMQRRASISQFSVQNVCRTAGYLSDSEHGEMDRSGHGKAAVVHARIVPLLGWAARAKRRSSWSYVRVRVRTSTWMNVHQAPAPAHACVSARGAAKTPARTWAGARRDYASGRRYLPAEDQWHRVLVALSRARAPASHRQPDQRRRRLDEVLPGWPPRRPPWERDGSPISGRDHAREKASDAVFEGRKVPRAFRGKKSQPRKRGPPFRPRPRIAFRGGGWWGSSSGRARRTALAAPCSAAPARLSRPCRRTASTRTRGSLRCAAGGDRPATSTPRACLLS